MNVSPQPIVLKLTDDLAVDEGLMQEWSATVAGADPTSKIMVDASCVRPLKEAELRLISRHLGNLAKGRHCELVMICGRETETLLGQMGLDRVIKCFQVHTKAAPEPRVRSEDLSKEMKQELSLFFAHLAGSLQRISSQLFSMEMRYHPPLEMLGGTPESTDANPEFTLTRADSATFSYVILFLVGPKEKQAFADKLFKGLKVPDAAMRDLLPEFLNNTMGSLVSQFSTSTPAIQLKSRIPEPCAREVACAALKSSTGKVRLQFKHDQLTMSVIVGYSLKC